MKIAEIFGALLKAASTVYQISTRLCKLVRVYKTLLLEPNYQFIKTE